MARLLWNKSREIDFYFWGIPLDARTGELITDKRQATKLVLDNLLSIVEAVDGSLETIAKVYIFLISLEEYLILNEECTAFFGKCKPARVISQIAVLPANTIFEMAMIVHMIEQTS